jgi:hypothetical protein
VDHAGVLVIEIVRSVRPRARDGCSGDGLDTTTAPPAITSADARYCRSEGWRKNLAVSGEGMRIFLTLTVCAGQRVVGVA